MSGALAGLSLSERMKAYWFASRILKDVDSDAEPRRRAKSVLRLLGQHEPTNRLRGAALAVLAANSRSNRHEGRSRRRTGMVVPLPVLGWLPSVG